MSCINYWTVLNVYSIPCSKLYLPCSPVSLFIPHASETPEVNQLCTALHWWPWWWWWCYLDEECIPAIKALSGVWWDCQHGVIGQSIALVTWANGAQSSGGQCATIFLQLSLSAVTVVITSNRPQISTRGANTFQLTTSQCFQIPLRRWHVLIMKLNIWCFIQLCL